MDDTEQADRWQYSRNGTIISGQMYEEEDADAAQMWDGDFLCLAVRRDGYDPARWRIDASDAMLPDDAHDELFTSPAEALDWLRGTNDPSPKPGTVRIDRPGMRPLTGELVFACPDHYVVKINGRERIIKAIDGNPVRFRITKVE